MGHRFHAHPIVKAIDLVGVLAAVGHHTAETNLVVLGLGLDRRNDPIHRKDGIEIVGGHDQAVIGMLQGGRKATTHHITQHIKNHHVGVFEQVVLLEQLHGLARDIAATARTRRRTTGFDTHHPIEALKDKVLGA